MHDPHVKSTGHQKKKEVFCDQCGLYQQSCDCQQRGAERLEAGLPPRGSVYEAERSKPHTHNHIQSLLHIHRVWGKA